MKSTLFYTITENLSSKQNSHRCQWAKHASFQLHFMIKFTTIWRKNLTAKPTNEQKDSKLRHQWKTNFYFIWKVIQLSKLQLKVFNRPHSSFSAASANLCLQDWLLWTLIMGASHATQWHHLCICPLTDDRHRPITVHVVSQLLFKYAWPCVYMMTWAFTFSLQINFCTNCWHFLNEIYFICYFFILPHKLKTELFKYNEKQIIQITIQDNNEYTKLQYYNILKIEYKLAREPYKKPGDL